ncbi:MAG TPA: L-threonylcarbamoyladenylate synthase [Thermoanaerobaculia bacterium]|jgi:tRNA threonylcarbamoyl adenosine modification protein (Sua5/YciO/YrdC/YwlC family)|nr:L-threonylcarbamoyladenylate synthase [Thermoanaerobaculia bacterium]
MIHWTLEDLDAVAEALQGSAVILLPTDTIYGLHAVATNEEAVERIATMKGRDAKPFVVLAASMEQLNALGVQMPNDVRNALGEVWPAALTAILPLAAPLPATRGASSIAVRIPALPWLRELLERTGPLVSTSANRSGEVPVQHPNELAQSLQDGLDGLVEAGRLSGEASAIVDFTGTTPRVVRGGELFFTQKVWKTLRISL